MEMMASLAGPVMGSRGDWYMLKETGIEGEILRLWREEQVRREERLYLYGDPAYCASATTMGAYKRAAGAQLTAQQHLCNSQMSSCRISVEHGFAHVQNPCTRLSPRLLVGLRGSTGQRCSAARNGSTESGTL